MSRDEGAENRVRDIDADAGCDAAEPRRPVDIDNVAAGLLNGALVALLGGANAQTRHRRETRLGESCRCCLNAREKDRDIDVALVGEAYGCGQVDLEAV